MSDSNIFFIDSSNRLLSAMTKKAFPPSSGKESLSLSGWAPSEQFNFFKATPPVYKKAIIEKTVPFMVEEYLIEPVDTYHFTLALQGRGNPVAVCATSHKSMADWLELLKIASIRPKNLFPDILALPWSKNNASVYFSGSRSIARTGACDGFCGRGGKDELFTGLLDRQLEESGTSIKVYADKPSSVPARYKKFVANDSINWLDLLRKAELPDNSYDLLQGKYTQANLNKSQGGSAGLVVKAVAAIILLLLAGDFVLLGIEKTEEANKQELSRALYSQIFKEDIQDITQLKNRVLVNLERANDNRQREESVVWQRTLELSDILANCQQCNIRRFKIGEDSRRVEIIFDSAVENALDPQLLTGREWRMLSSKSASPPENTGFERVYTTTMLLEKNKN